jgi:non-heme chloroperoxidase
LNALMEKLDLRGATLVGFSMGGGEVARYLSSYGLSRVNKAVLISSITPYLLKTPDNPEGVDQKIFDDMNENLLKDRPAFLKTFAPVFYGRSLINHSVSEAVLEWTAAVAYRSSLRPTVASAKAFAVTDFREDIAKITIPVLVIHGTSDNTVPIENSGRRAVKLLPNATLSEYDGEPHGLFLTSADRLNAELAEFINGTKFAV